MKTKNNAARSLSVAIVRLRSSWRDHEMMWVIGCIDSNGSIVANATKEGRCHRPDEQRGKRWRFCVWSQDFSGTFGGMADATTDEENFAICDWLIRHGYADERILPNVPGQGRAQNGES